MHHATAGDLDRRGVGDLPRIDDIEFSRSSLYDVLSGHYDLSPASAHETHFAFAVSREDALLLRIGFVLLAAGVAGSALVAVPGAGGWP